MKTTPLRYLGSLSGHGVVTQNGAEVAQATFDLDGYFRAPAGVTGCGEIKLPAGVLQSLFGGGDLQLLTDQGRLLDLRFSELTPPPAGDVAHVDVTAVLPMKPGDWLNH
jgi:hypothetical protein